MASKKKNQKQSKHRAPRNSVPASILTTLLNNESATVAQLAEEAGVSARQCSVTLQRLKHRGLAKASARGEWKLNPGRVRG